MTIEIIEENQIIQVDETNFEIIVSSPAASFAATTLPYIDLDQALDPPNLAGRIAWDPDAGTARIGMPGGNVVLQVGQEMLTRVRNRTGSTILNGTVVYISGATGRTAEISRANSSSYDQSQKTIAMATEDIPDNGFGYVNTFGIVRDLDTQGIPEGTVLYLGTNGAYTTTPPAYPLNRVMVGICLYEHNNQGMVIFYPRMITRKFGDPDAGNHTGIDDSGHVINYGQARTWNDLPPIPLLVQRQGAANNPALTAFSGNISQLTFAVNDYVFGNYELLHEYVQGSDLSPHIHFVTNGAVTTERRVKWELEYTISNADALAPFSEVFPATTTISVEVVFPAGTPDRAHIIASFPDIVGTGLRIGAYICYRLRRIASSGTAPAANPFGLTLGFHVLQDTQGSDTVGVKNIGG